MKLSRLETLSGLGFRSDPFRAGAVRIETQDMRRLKGLVEMAVSSHAMVAVVGMRGAGKTETIESALRKRDCAIVRITAADKEAIKISDIETAMIMMLSDESVKRSKIVRGYQLRKLIDSVSQRKEIVLLIEEAHRIHGQTLRSIKTLREPDGGGGARFTVIFIGQYSFLDTKRGVDEVRLRADTVQMNGLRQPEAEEYLRKTVGQVFEESALKRLSEQQESGNFLDLQYAAVSAMERAYLAGKSKVSVSDLADTLEMPESKTLNGDGALKDILQKRKGA